MTAMAATAEELELQDQVTRALESQGVLGKIKAQLRAAVYETIHSAGTARESDQLGTRGSRSSVVPVTAMLQSFGADAPVALELVRNFLECLELDHTLAVFIAEAGMDTSGSSAQYAPPQWRVPARLCERVRVPAADEATPVLVKMLRRDRGEGKLTREAEFQDAEPTPALPPVGTLKRGFVDDEEDIMVSEQVLKPPPAMDLPSPQVKTSPAPTTQQRFDEDEDGEMEASIADEVASGSFEEESLAESASVEESPGNRMNPPMPVPAARPGRFGIQKEDTEEGEEEGSPSIASPPPGPTKLGPLPSLPGMGTTSKHTKPSQGESDDDEQAERHSEIPEPDESEDDELDDDAAAARLRSLEEKLKEMEAEDDTGILQQLKETALVDDDGDEPPTTHNTATVSSTATSGKPGDGNDGNEADDNYGSDFEEEIEEDDEEVASEMSEDIASMSMLSDSEDGPALTKPTAKVPPKDPLANDTPVASEDALNSYDYIEAVERHS